MTFWTPEQDAVLAADYGKQTINVLADRLGVTRNAVAGRAKRLGINTPVDAPDAPDKAKPRHTAAARAQMAKGHAAGVAGQPLPFANIGPRPRSCRFIEGEGRPFTDESYCGDPVQPLSSWCPEHHARCFVKTTIKPTPVEVNPTTGRLWHG